MHRMQCSSPSSSPSDPEPEAQVPYADWRDRRIARNLAQFEALGLRHSLGCSPAPKRKYRPRGTKWQSLEQRPRSTRAAADKQKGLYTEQPEEPQAKANRLRAYMARSTPKTPAIPQELPDIWHSHFNNDTLAMPEAQRSALACWLLQLPAEGKAMFGSKLKSRLCQTASSGPS